MNSTLKIQNLKCGGCANTIITKLGKLEGVSNVTVSTDDNSVTFAYLSNNAIHEVTNLLSKLGYPVEGENNPLSKQAKSFVSCAVGRLNS